ncbi:hypothetical protein KY330_03465 [Candidatus Woesearchaeota archaeon]|nr:hypothetical protein [Candidatus Woesearchaeota archaeon]
MKIVGSRKDDLLEDALNDSFFEFKNPKPKKEARHLLQPFERIKWQENVMRGAQNSKWADYYESHLELLKEGGWERAPYPSEYYGLFFATWKGESRSELRLMMDRIRESEPEFTCCAYISAKGKSGRFSKSVLILENPNLYWHSITKSYAQDGRCAQRIFHVELEPGVIDLKTFDEKAPELFEFIYSRRYADFPEIKGIESQRVKIPEKGKLCMLGFGSMYGTFNPFKKPQMASRGVREYTAREWSEMNENNR